MITDGAQFVKSFNCYIRTRYFNLHLQKSHTRLVPDPHSFCLMRLVLLFQNISYMKNEGWRKWHPAMTGDTIRAVWCSKLPIILCVFSGLWEQSHTRWKLLAPQRREIVRFLNKPSVIPNPGITVDSPPRIHLRFTLVNHWPISCSFGTTEDEWSPWCPRFDCLHPIRSILSQCIGLMLFYRTEELQRRVKQTVFLVYLDDSKRFREK